MIGGQQRWEIVVESASVFGLSHSGCFRRERRRLVFLFNVLMIEKLHLVIIRDLPSGVYDDFDPAGGLQIILALVGSYLGDRGTRMAHATYRATVRIVTHARDLGALVRLCTGSLRSGRIHGPKRISGGASAAGHNYPELLTARNVVSVSEPVSQVQAG